MYLEIFPFECDSHCQMLCASKKPLSVQSLSFAQLCDPMDCSTPAFPVHHQLPEVTQTYVHQVGDAIQPPHSQSPPSPLVLNVSQHQGLFQWVGSSHQVAKVLELQLQHLSFQWLFRVVFLLDWLFWSPCCPRDSKESSPAPQFESISSSVLSLPLWSNSHIPEWLLEKA